MYTSRVFAVASGHVPTMLLDHMSLEVQRRVEHDEFTRLALFLRAGEVHVIEVLFQLLIVEEAITRSSSFPKTRADRYALLISDLVPFANEALLVALPHMGI